jgi:hypothetical protein
MRVWIYYDPANPEIHVYGKEPPTNFGRRQYDIGPIEIDDELIERYEALRDAWRSVHSELVLAVKRDAHSPSLVADQARSERIQGLY